MIKSINLIVEVKNMTYNNSSKVIEKLKLALLTNENISKYVSEILFTFQTEKHCDLFKYICDNMDQFKIEENSLFYLIKHLIYIVIKHNLKCIDYNSFIKIYKHLPNDIKYENIIEDLNDFSKKINKLIEKNIELFDILMSKADIHNIICEKSLNEIIYFGALINRKKDEKNILKLYKDFFKRFYNLKKHILHATNNNYQDVHTFYNLNLLQTVKSNKSVTGTKHFKVFLENIEKIVDDDNFDLVFIYLLSFSSLLLKNKFRYKIYEKIKYILLNFKNFAHNLIYELSMTGNINFIYDYHIDDFLDFIDLDFITDMYEKDVDIFLNFFLLHLLCNYNKKIYLTKKQLLHIEKIFNKYNQRTTLFYKLTEYLFTEQYYYMPSQCFKQFVVYYLLYLNKSSKLIKLVKIYNNGDINILSNENKLRNFIINKYDEILED